MYMEHIITEVFKKYDIQDEKLALALNEILEAYYREMNEQLARDVQVQSYMNGIR
ncbi:hypothetical protein P4U65_24680 [Bacillus pacificus]|nr:hypothetical protein [Bacillus thuringiensis]MED1303687.1 hypothetical protein [Bacillus pacificus]